MRTQAFLHSIVLIALVLALCGCRRDDQPTVVLYVSADEHVARQVVDKFQEQTGIRVLMVGDTEVKKTAGLVDRLRSEKDRPRADVFWSSEIFMTIELADEGMFEPYTSEAVANWPVAFRDAGSVPLRSGSNAGSALRERVYPRWYGFAARARVIAYAPDRVPEEFVPQTWMALTNDRFRGRIVMADPRFGTTGGHLGAMKAYWDREIMPGYYRAFLEGLAENQIRLLASGNAGVVEAIARGEADVGMTDTDDVWAAQARGWNVQMVYPAHNLPSETGIGTLVIPNTVALIKGGPHPVQAKRLIEFLLSEQVERMLAESVSHNAPIRPSLAAKHPQYAVPDPLKVDYKLAASMRSSAIEQAMRILRQSSSETQPAANQSNTEEVRDAR